MIRKPIADYPVTLALAKALGEEAAGKLVSEWRECISQVDTRDSRPRAELSFVAAPAGQ